MPCTAVSAGSFPPIQSKEASEPTFRRGTASFSASHSSDTRPSMSNEKQISKNQITAAFRQHLEIPAFSFQHHIHIPPLPHSINSATTMKQTRNAVTASRTTNFDRKPDSSMAAFLMSIIGPNTRNPISGPAGRLPAILLATTASEDEQRDRIKASPIIRRRAFHGADPLPANTAEGMRS